MILRNVNILFFKNNKLSKDPKVIKGKWFLPSKDEWVTYAGELGITCGTEGNKGENKYSLKNWYWSSTVYSQSYAWRVLFDNGYMHWNGICDEYSIRLAATF